MPDPIDIGKIFSMLQKYVTRDVFSKCLSELLRRTHRRMMEISSEK
jgi:hypothetical protein